MASGKNMDVAHGALGRESPNDILAGSLDAKDQINTVTSFGGPTDHFNEDQNFNNMYEQESRIQVKGL